MFTPDPAGRKKPVVLLLGCAHIGGSAGQHVIESAYDDMLAPDRQRQIAACVERLARFRPTKVAIEHPAEAQADVDADYQAFRRGAFALTASEDHQFGFRIAAALDLPRVHAVDVLAEEVFARSLGEAVAAAETAHPWLYERLMARRAAGAKAEAALRTTPMIDLLRQWNDPAALAEDHAAYLALAQTIAGGAHIGAGWVQGWYARNLRIYANLVQLVQTPSDRVLAVYGVGHIPLLAQFLRDSGMFDVEAPLSYLAV
jgi:hypothetical protein